MKVRPSLSAKKITTLLYCKTHVIARSGTEPVISLWSAYSKSQSNPLQDPYTYWNPHFDGALALSLRGRVAVKKAELSATSPISKDLTPFQTPHPRPTGPPFPSSLGTGGLIPPSGAGPPGLGLRGVPSPLLAYLRLPPLSSFHFWLVLKRTFSRRRPLDSSQLVLASSWASCVACRQTASLGLCFLLRKRERA